MMREHEGRGCRNCGAAYGHSPACRALAALRGGRPDDGFRRGAALTVAAEIAVLVAVVLARHFLG